MPRTELIRACWVLIYRAPDLPGQWIAHNLDCDVVTQGDSPEDAFDCAYEATQMFVSDELARGADPLAMSAPREDWMTLIRVLKEGTPTADVSRETPHDRLVIAAQLVIRVSTTASEPAVDPVAPERTAFPWMGLQVAAA